MAKELIRQNSKKEYIMALYKKKPVLIEAIQWKNRNIMEICNFMGKFTPQIFKGNLIIRTLEGDMIINDHDFIIRGIKGEFYPCKPLIFRDTYILVSE